MPSRLPRATGHHSDSLPSDRVPDRVRRGNTNPGPTGLDRDTTRLPHLSDEDQTRRDKRDALARKNLAAIICDLWGVDLADPDADDIALVWAANEFHDLTDMLGLNGDGR